MATTNPTPTRFTNGLMPPNKVSPPPEAGGGSLWYKADNKLYYYDTSISDWVDVATSTTLQALYDSLAEVARTGSYDDLLDKPDIPSEAPVQSVNGRIGAVTGLAEQSDLAAEISRASLAESNLQNGINASISLYKALTPVDGSATITDTQSIGQFPKFVSLGGQLYAISPTTSSESPKLVQFNIATGVYTFPRTLYTGEDVGVLYSQSGNPVIIPDSIVRKSDFDPIADIVATAYRVSPSIPVPFRIYTAQDVFVTSSVDVSQVDLGDSIRITKGAGASTTKNYFRLGKTITETIGNITSTFKVTSVVSGSVASIGFGCIPVGSGTVQALGYIYRGDNGAFTRQNSFDPTTLATYPVFAINDLVKLVLNLGTVQTMDVYVNSTLVGTISLPINLTGELCLCQRGNMVTEISKPRYEYIKVATKEELKAVDDKIFLTLELNERYNILNPAVVTGGMVWSRSGDVFTLTVNSTYNAYDLTPVESDTDYKASYSNTTADRLRRTFFLRSDLTYISEINVAHSAFHTPVGAAYIRGSYFATVPLDGCCINKGTTSIFQPYIVDDSYQVVLTDESKDLEPKSDNSLVNFGYFKANSSLPLKDLVGAVLADSSSAINTSGWVSYASGLMGMVIQNFAVGGATWGTIETSPGVLGNCIRKQIDQLVASGLNPDFILCQGGGNDIGSTPMGSLSAAFSNNNYKGIDDTTVYGGIRYGVERLIRTYPNAIIVVGTTFQRVVDDALPIATAIKEVAQKLSVNVIDGYNYSGISNYLECPPPAYSDNPSGPSDYTREYPRYNWVELDGSIVTVGSKTPDAVKRYGKLTYDGKHQTVLGSEWIGDFFSRELIRIVQKL